MELHDLKRLDMTTEDSEYKVSIKYDRIEQDFSATSRNLILFSKVEYSTKDFTWDAILPTVKIPYRDPSMGFMLDGVVFSSVGIYQRAPGVVLSKEPSVVSGLNDRVDIVTSRNSTLSICYKRNGVNIGFRKGGKDKYVPFGIFLKAFSGLPYDVLLDRFVFKPSALWNSFPCEVPTRAVDLAKVNTYGIDAIEEPKIEDCVNLVYSAILQTDERSQGTMYSAHWKTNRIHSYFDGLHFKTEQNYESTLALHSRARGTYLDQELHLPIYLADGSVSEFSFPRGTFISEDIAEQLRWYDVSTLRVRLGRSFLLQEDTPMLFRALGYKLVSDIASLDLEAGHIIDKESLKKINASDIRMLEVYTPTGRKVLTRSGVGPDVGDFYTILNTLFTASFIERDDASQYEVANRIIIDYSKQVMLEVEQTYQNIIDSLAGCTQLKNIIQSLPKLPSASLASRLRDSDNKELTQAEITNVMSRAVAEKRASALMKSAPAAMMAVQKGQYGRIDSLHSPESDKVGAVQEVTAMAHLNSETGELEAPYEKIISGKPTGIIEYISAAKENNKYIVGWDDELDKEVVLARYNGDVTTVTRDRVDYRDVSPFCDMSVSRMTIPFPEFSQPRRSLMATKMSGQAVPLLFPERPLVSTGADTEIPCLYYTARQVVSQGLGEQALSDSAAGQLEIVNVKWTKMFAMYTCLYAKQSFVFSVPFTATDKETLYNYNLNYQEDYKYSLDDVVFYNQSCDIEKHEYYERVKQGTLPLIKNLGQPALALGTNLRVMYKTYRSSTVDDAVVISDRLITNRKLSSVQIFKYDYTLKVGETFRAYDGIAKLHSHVYAGEPVITAIRTKGSGKLEKHVYTKQPGEVILTEIAEADGVSIASVWVATLHDAAIGDKVAGRYGNKSVIAKIIPESEMPYDPETGESADIICSPLGIPSRMNYGQLVEVTLGAVMAAQGKYAVVTPFYPNIKSEVEKLYTESGLTMKRLYNPVYGKFTERPVMVGYMYFLKLEQMANLKCSAVGYPRAVDPVFGQPVTSTNINKGQAIGEMETWALAAAGAHKILNNLFTLYASDEFSRKRYFEMLNGNSDKGPHGWDETTEDALHYQPDNKDALVTQTVLRMFGQELIVKGGDKYLFVPLNLGDIQVIATPLDLKNHSEEVSENEWCKVKLQAPVVNPFWIENFPLNVVLGVKSVKTLVNQTYYLNVYDRSIHSAKSLTETSKAALITGVDAVIALLENTTVDQALERLVNTSQATDNARSGAVLDEVENSSDDIDVEVIEAQVLTGDEDIDRMMDVSSEVADVVRFLYRMKDAGLELRDLVWHYMPIIPKVFRQTTVTKGVEREHSFQKQLRHICDCAKSSDIYKALCAFIGYGQSRDDDLVSLRGYFFGKESQSGQHGTVRGNVLSKRVGFSGRAVIVPATDIHMSPFFIGIPWSLAMIELSRVLAIRLTKRAVDLARDLPFMASGSLESLSTNEWEEIICSLGEYNEYIFNKHFPTLDHGDTLYFYNYLRSVVQDICQGNVSEDGRVRVNGEWVLPEEVPDGTTIDAAVVQVGRQPTLHKRSTRCYFMRLVDGYSIQIHPIVCDGFNADFDGDTMWHLQLVGELKNEGWRTISVLQDLISEKDGSYTLGLKQDTALGLYCATIFKDNTKTFQGLKGRYYYFDSADALEMQLKYGDLHYYDVVVFEDQTNRGRYISTAGRVLVNARVPGALTRMPLDDKWKICEQVLGKEAAAAFCQLKYDTVWVATGIRSADRPDGVKIEQVLLDTYDTFGARTSVLVAQALYEVGLVASDIYSVSASMGDMSVDIDVEKFMEEPQEYVAKLNTLEQMGLVSERERKAASVRAWERARKMAMDEVVRAIPENSNTHLMMYSGARGKPDQVMQSVGFIGTISKTAQTDIEYPILRGYGSGLTSLDLAQTCYTARIGVVSTQDGTKDTGYATRQTVYMSSGMGVKEDDCGIDWLVERVPYSNEDAEVSYANGESANLASLLGEFVDPGTPNFDMLSADLNKSGYMITERVLSIIASRRITELVLLDKTVTIKYRIDAAWKQRMIEEGYSYALPHTVGHKITEESLDWIEKHGLREAVLFDKSIEDSDSCFDREAYLPVDYDASKYEIWMNGHVVGDEVLYGRAVSEDSEGYHYYKKLLDADAGITVKALQYLTKKCVRTIILENGGIATIRYKLSKLFRDLVVGRLSAGLPYLDSDSSITNATLQEIELCQLQAIPVRTTLTCLTVDGVCRSCRGKLLSTKQYARVGENLGIAAAQAQCEPLSQATLDVTHSGGKRGTGTGLVSGLSYYKRMLQGKLVSTKTDYQLENFAEESGYVKKNPHDDHFFQIVNEDGTVLQSCELDDPERLNVPDGAFVNKGDTIKTGLPQLNRYSSRDIFQSALNTRYLLLREYYRIFQALNVSPRNYEILAREQTSICYLVEQASLPPMRDTSVEITQGTGKYELRVAKQSEVVNKYSGIAGFAFENVANMVAAGALNSDGLALNSVLGNLVSGTPVGSTRAQFIPQRFGRVNQKYKKSAVKAIEDSLSEVTSMNLGDMVELAQGQEQTVGGISSLADSLLDDLLKIDSALDEGENIQMPSGLQSESVGDVAADLMEFKELVSDEESPIVEAEWEVISESPVEEDRSRDKEDSSGVKHMTLD